MTPLDALERYLAIKCHWDTPGYNFHTYNGRVNVRQSSLERRKDRRIFEAVCKNYNLEDWTDILVANIVDKYKFPFVGDLLEHDNVRLGMDWQKRRHDPLRALEIDLCVLKERFDCNFLDLFKHRIPSPHILRLFYHRMIKFDTMVHFNRVVKFIDSFDKKRKNDPLWPDQRHNIKRVEPFVPRIPETDAKAMIIRFFPLE